MLKNIYIFLFLNKNSDGKSFLEHVWLTPVNQYSLHPDEAANFWTEGSLVFPNKEEKKFDVDIFFNLAFVKSYIYVA